MSQPQVPVMPPVPPPPPPPTAPTKKPIWKRWWFWVGLVVVIGIIGSQSGGTGGDGSQAASSPSPGASNLAPTETQSAAPTETSAPPTTPAPPPEPKPISLQGSGHQATKIFTLVGGFTTFQVKAAGGSNVIVYLVNAQGKKVDLLVNTIGSYDGVSAVGVKPGKYLVDIDAPSSWGIRIEQPRPTSGKAPPQSYSGSQPDVLGPLQLNGLTRLVMKYAGNSNFIVYLVNERGVQVDLEANEIGHFSGSTVVSGSGGVYWLTVDADGEWSVKVQ